MMKREREREKERGREREFVREGSNERYRTSESERNTLWSKAQMLN